MLKISTPLFSTVFIATIMYNILIGGIKMTIYIDLFLITSFCMNILLFKLTGYFIRAKPSKLKTTLCSAISSIFTLSVFLPYITTALHIILNTIIIILSLILIYKPHNFISATRIVIVYITITFAIAGCSFMLVNFYGSNNIFLVLIPTTLFMYAISGLIAGMYEKYFKTDKLAHKLKICANNNTLEMVGYIDTGNCLTEPITKLPVVIIGLKTARDFLPEDFLSKICDNDISSVFAAYADKLKLKLIPFHTINGDGILIGFVPDAAFVDEKEINCIIGISKNLIFSENNKTAILHPQIII